MNKVKKVINPHTAKQPINYMVWIVTSIVLVVALIGGVLFDQLYQRPILTINGDKYTMNDLRYYFYTIESQYDYFNQALGGNYWDTKYDEQSGKTMREVAKQDAIDTSLYTEVLYKDAMKKGYKLTADEQKTIATNVKNLLDQQIPKVTANKNGFTTAYLTKVLDKATIIDRYRKDVIKTFNIDEAKITAGVSKEDNRQYDLEYLFISTKKTDDQGKSVDMTADEKTAAYNKINGIYDKALTTKDWSTLIPTDEKDLTYKKDNFVVNDSKFTTAFKTKMKTLNNNDISQVYQDADGYYIVRMLNNNSTEAYDNAVKQAINTAESDQFNTYYQDLLKSYPYKVNNKELSKYKMGEITINN